MGDEGAASVFGVVNEDELFGKGGDAYDQPGVNRGNTKQEIPDSVPFARKWIKIDGSKTTE